MSLAFASIDQRGQLSLHHVSDPAREDPLCEIESVRRFTRLSIRGPLPDETTILNFSHLLERHQLGKKLFKETNSYLDESRLILKEGTIVDPGIIAAHTLRNLLFARISIPSRQARSLQNWLLYQLWYQFTIRHITFDFFAVAFD